MGFDDEHWPSSPTVITTDLLSFNPFAPDEDLSGSQARPAEIVLPDASSNGDPQLSQRPSYPSHLHPLRSAGLRTDSNTAGVTRPRLSRIVDVAAQVDNSPVITGDGESISVEEKEVFIHEVTSDDSLAGISLKYGISMAELRRANHLWTSDSIHIRKELYIPVDKSSRAKDIVMDGQLISITPQEEMANPIDLLGEDDAKDSQFLEDKSGTGTIRRIPTAHLSFFPPPSNRHQISKLSPDTQEYGKATNHIRHTRYASSPSNTLTNFVNALPMAPSTRDTIMSRLSLDGISSSSSDKDLNEDLHEHLELDEVRRDSRDDSFIITENLDSSSLLTPKPIHEIYKLTEIPKHSPTTHPRNRHLSSSPQSYIPPHAGQVRTVQLEPSPTMQLPVSVTNTLRSKDRKLKRDTLIDLGFELEEPLPRPPRDGIS